MTDAPLSLSTMIGSRICHDLISPVGAIGNGLELLAMGGPLDSPEMSLINDSVTDAKARIRLFRVAFGMASAEQEIGTPEIRDILAGVYGQGRVSVDWQADGHVARRQLQAVFLAILCAETTVPRGGNVTVAQNGDRWVITSRGDAPRFEPDLWAGLTDTGGDLMARLGGMRPADVQFALLPECLRAIGRQPTIDQREDGVTLSF